MRSGLVARTLAQEPVVLDRIGRGSADDLDPVRPQVVDGLLLGRVEVPGGDDLGAATAQRHEQRRGLGFQVDPRPDAQAGERLRPLELVTRLAEQSRAVGDPFEPRHGTVPSTSSGALRRPGR